MKKIFAYLLSAVMLIITAAMPTFAVESQVSYYQTDSGSLKVFVSLGSDAYGNVMLTVFDKDSYDESVFSDLTDEEKAALIKYNGTATLEGGIAEFEFGIDGETGHYPYSVSVQYDSSVIDGERFAFVDDEEDVLSNINNKTAREIGDYLSENAELVFGSTGIYADSVKTKINTTLAEKSWASTEDVFNAGYRISLEEELTEASASDKIMILTSYDEILAYDKPEYEIFLGEDAEFKNYAVALIKGEFTEEKLYEAVDLAELKNTENYTEVKTILERMSNSIEIDLDDYFDMKDTSAVDAALVGAEYSTGDDLQKAVAAAIKMNEKPGGGSGGGRGGVSGGISTSKTDKPVYAPIVNTAEEKESNFKDLVGYDWAKPAIEVLADKGILNGKAYGVFAPGDKVSREELVKMLVCIFDIYESDAKTDFKDLNGHWSASYIASAEKYGLVKGISEISFGVGEALSREDMAVLCYRFMNAFGIKLDVAETEDFADAKEISDYAHEAVKVLKGANVINGKENNKFAPKDGCSRAEAAKVVYYIYTAKNK